MSFRETLAFVAAAACLVPAAASAAEKLDKDSKKWLDQVRPLILPEEEKVFRELKDKSERDEFQKIFWARRDPDLETPANEFRTEYEKTVADVDTRFRVAGKPGSATDCGRVYILLGVPDDVKRDAGAGAASPRSPETWIYRDRPGMKFKDGQAQIMFDAECALPQGVRLAEQMNRVAEGKIANPNIDYRKGTDGRLVKAADQLPKPSPGTALLKAPRQDFPVSAQSKMFLRSPGGTSYVAGLVRGDAAGLSVQDTGGKKTVKVVVAAQAVDESGKPAATTEREMVADVGPDNSFVASYGMALKPGSYTLNVGALDPAGHKGSVASTPLKMPDFGTDELTVSELMVLQDVQDVPSVSPEDPFGAFALGNTRVLPRFGNVFSPSESIMLLSVAYNAKVDDATGKASVTAGFTISKDGKPVAQAQDQSYDSPTPIPAVGPVPLDKYEPGKYLARLKIRDNVAQKDYTREAEFEIK
jgi:GWxTD domain-containing protein